MNHLEGIPRQNSLNQQTAENLEIRNSWLLLTKDTHSLQHGGNDGYHETLGQNYRFDSTVPNSRDLTLGDRIALWNGSILLGVSRVASISAHVTQKQRHRCPDCGSTKIKPRQTRIPRYRCQSGSCNSEFDEPIHEVLTVTEYVLDYSQHWRPFGGSVSTQEIRGLAIRPKTINSIRRLEEVKFNAFLEIHRLEI